MSKIQLNVLLSVSLAAVACILLMTPIPSHSQQGNSDKEELLRALQKRELLKRDLNTLMERMRRYKVSYKLSGAEEQEFRNAGEYLGPKNIDELIRTIRENPREPERKSAAAAATPSPPGEKAKPTVQLTPATTRRGTELVGISGTGVKAKVMVGGRSSYGGPAILLIVENASESGTITNIGFIVKAQTSPTSALKREDDKGVTGPGVYRLTKERWVIQTRDFKAVSAFGLVTADFDSDAVSPSFHRGFIGAGIPPGKTTWFALTGFGEFTGRDLERGIVLRFQAIGEDDKADIAMFPKLDALLPSATEQSIYEIERIRDK